MTASLAPLLTTAAAADQLGITTAQLTRLRRSGTGPDHLRIGHSTIRYSPAALEKWTDRHGPATAAGTT